MRHHNVKELSAFMSMLRPVVGIVGLVTIWGGAVVLVLRDRWVSDAHKPLVDCVFSSIVAFEFLLVGLGVPKSKRLQRLLLVNNANWRDGWYGFVSIALMGLFVAFGCVMSAVSYLMQEA